jgi:putative SOS response-associated peptidase YedK
MLMDKPMGRTPFKKHRCLVPADGFYEWRRPDPKTKIPYACSLKDGGPFGFAGIWDAGKDAQGRWLESFAIITTVRELYTLSRERGIQPRSLPRAACQNDAGSGGFS